MIIRTLQLRAVCFNGERHRGVRKLLITTLTHLRSLIIPCRSHLINARTRTKKLDSVESQKSHGYRNRRPIGSTEINKGEWAVD